MKKVYSILFMLMGLVMYSQEIIRPASAYYSADNLRQRTDITRAILDGVQVWKDSGFVEMEIPLYQPMLKMRFPEIKVGVQKEVYYKDSIDYLDTAISFKNEKYQGKGWYNLRYYYERYGPDEYLVNIEELPNQPTRYVLDSVLSQDSLSIVRQYFFTKHWLFSKREHNNLDSLKVTQFTEFGFTPGYAIIKGDSVRRHSQTFRKKYYQVRAKDTTFNTIDTLSIYGNPLMKLP